MKTILRYLAASFFFVMPFTLVKAQCPSTLTITVTGITHSVCPDNGSVVLGGTGLGNPAVTYSILSGPSRVGTQQGSNTFNSLTAGTYVFRAACNSSTADISVTVNNLYTPINPDFPVSVTDVCSNFAPGGNINVLSVTGGKAPLQYSFIKNNAANYDDALSVYSSASTFFAATWGVYQVRVKDACGVFVTKSVNVQPLYPPATFGDGDLDFDDNVYSCDSAAIWFWMTNDDGEGVDLSDYPSLRFNIYERTGSTSQCNKGALIKTFDLTSSSYNFFVIPKRDVVVDIITPCGDIRTNCYDYPDDDDLQTLWQPVIKGCGTIPNPNTLSLIHQYHLYGRAPYTIKLYNNTTNALLQTVNNSNCSYDCFTFSGLPMGITYRIDVTDACGKTASSVYSAPVGAPGFAPVNGGTFVEQGCTFQNGKISARLAVTGAVFNLDTATLIISSGPDNIGQKAKRNSNDGLFYFSELTPNATYGFVMNTGCSTVTFTFTVPNDPSELVQFTMTPVVTQQCGGSGTIDAGLSYNGWGTVRTELWNGGVKVSENNSGVYANIAPGTYTVKSVAEQNWCTLLQQREISETVTVLSNGTAPQVLRQFGSICENAGNQLLSTGSVAMEVAGFAPFRYDIKRISPNPQAAYTTLATNAGANYTLTGLDAYAVYNILIIDNCGKSTTTEVVIGEIGKVSFSGQFQPCVGANYSVTAPRIAGATYEWKKKDEAAVLSTTRDLFLPNYAAGYDGDYVCTVTLAGGCVQRTMNTTLSSTLCGYILPVNFTTVTAFAQQCKPQINWTVADAKDGVYEVERSADAVRFTAINKLQSKAGQLSYELTDMLAPSGDLFYRVKFTGSEGKNIYSKILKVTNSCSAKTAPLQVYPNPVTGNTANLIFQSGETQTVEVSVVNTSGQKVHQQKIYAAKGAGSYNIDVTSLAPGMYYFKVQAGGILIGSTKVIKK